MTGGVLSMNGKERERAFVVRHCVQGDLSQREASERLGVCVRQVNVCYRRGDGTGCAHGRENKP
jgi:hypothetical protein